MHMTIVVVHSILWFCFHFSFKDGFFFFMFANCYQFDVQFDIFIASSTLFRLI
jgi:hypothetical protein